MLELGGDDMVVRSERGSEESSREIERGGRAGSEDDLAFTFGPDESGDLRADGLESLRCRFGEGIESSSDIGRERFLVFPLRGDDLLWLGTGRARVQIDQARMPVEEGEKVSEMAVIWHANENRLKKSTLILPLYTI